MDPEIIEQIAERVAEKLRVDTGETAEYIPLARVDEVLNSALTDEPLASTTWIRPVIKDCCITIAGMKDNGRGGGRKFVVLALLNRKIKQYIEEQGLPTNDIGVPVNMLPQIRWVKREDFDRGQRS